MSAAWPRSASCPTNEMVLADGYGNQRVSVWDATTMKFKRMWGAYGKTPNDDPIPHYDVNSPQFGNPVHCAQPSNDGLIYVCDRTNNRIQVFKTDGTFVKQYIVKPGHQGRRLGVGDRLLARSAAEVHVHLGRRQREHPCLRPPDA